MTVTDHTDPTPGISPDVEELALMFAKIITSKHNQHAIVMIVGAAGKGKSWAAIALARGVAVRVSEILGGQPEDYFNFEETFATISKEQVKKVMKNPKKHTILVIDDAAADAMNARRYKTQDNIDFNSELTTFRPNHNLVILTTQAGFLIDKVPRSLCHFIIEMEQAYFDQGITIAKVKQVTYSNSTQKLHFPYIQSGAQKFVRHIFYAPPKEITDAYEIERDRQQRTMNDVKEQDIKPERISKFDILTPSVLSWHEEGLSQSKIADKVGISQGWVSKILNANGIC